ncbi:DNA-binding protein [Flavipsychrobacter stenotrophus]|uniref:DNA-binding protein n=1 Tax=Flavipsychrobacter stenotrophus TaxID=2077091 RepID=A0A2S7SS86_9BACT|nr:DNA-binding protein [Flavipsychrobacter stenotrophus]
MTKIENLTATIQEMLFQMRTSKRLLSVDEVACYLGVSKSCIYKWTHQRIIPHSKIQGKTLFFERHQVTRWAMQNQVPTRDKILEKALITLKHR